MAGEIELESPPAILAEPEPVTRDSLIELLDGQLTAMPASASSSEAVADTLIREGLVVEGAPPARTILTDAKTFAERTILAELVVRLFRFYVLGSIVLPDTPAALDWLKCYIDGVGGQGPLGAGPLRWPRMVPSACNLLAQWGFEPTASEPPYVIKRRPG